MWVYATIDSSEGDLTIFLDDLKMESLTESNIFSDKLVLNWSYRLPYQAGVLLAKSFTIEQAAHIIKTRNQPASNLII